MEGHAPSWPQLAGASPAAALADRIANASGAVYTVSSKVFVPHPPVYPQAITPHQAHDV